MLRPAFLALLALSLSAAAAEPGASGGAMSLLRQIDEGFVQVYEKVAPSVVIIEATKKPGESERDELRGFDFFLEGGKEPGGESGERPWVLPRSSEGSGFIIRADGYVLTNHHVVADADKIVVRLRDGRSFPGKRVGVDEKTDIAIVRIDARELPAAELGDSDRVRVGQLVCAIGAPFNQPYSFSVGWVSGKGRTNLLGATSDNILLEDYLQTDTFINPGNSGGPLFDVEGRVIGMNTLINGLGRGLAFAIPSNMFQEVAQQLIAHGRIQRAWLGISMEPLREQLANIGQGVVVDKIVFDSPAHKSELLPKDVIVAVDGVKVGAPLEVQKEVFRKKIGTTVQLTVWRSGTTLRIPVATGELPATVTQVANVRTGKLGVSGKAETLGLKLRDAPRTGAVVAEVVAGSPASRAGVQLDDLISEVEGRTVRDGASALAAIGDRTREGRGKSVTLTIERSDKRTTVVITPDR